MGLTRRPSSPQGRFLSSPGPMAEWLRRGLQILARRFDSGSGLHFFRDLTNAPLILASVRVAAVRVGALAHLPQHFRPTGPQETPE